MIKLILGQPLNKRKGKWIWSGLLVLSMSYAYAAVGLGGDDFKNQDVALEKAKLAELQRAKKNGDFDPNKEKVRLQSSMRDGLLAEHEESNAKESSLRDQIFAKMTNNLMPMSPEQIGTLRELYNRNKKASAQVGLVPPKPTSTSKIVDLSPGATPPVIRLSSGFITSLVFLDATGAPWPIKSYDLGDPSSYNIQWDKTGSTMMLQAITEYKSGNLAVMLEGLSTPVMLTLMPGQRAVDYRVDVQVPQYGPKATPTRSIVNLSDNGMLLAVLDGLPPKGGHAVNIKGAAAQAWLASDRLYLRTRLSVLSPGWVARMASADGTYAYEMPMTPVVLASKDGETVTLTLEGY